MTCAASGSSPASVAQEEKREDTFNRSSEDPWAVFLVFFVTLEYRDSMTERTKSRILGGCLCGEFKYQLGHELSNINNCHCLDCRRASAAPFVTWGSIQTEDFQVIAGELKKVNFADRVRSFAACCNTPILFQDSSDAQSVDVTIVSIEDSGSYAPSAEIWTDDKLPWVVLNPELPKYSQAKS
jgi:hypothetical protein